MKINCHGLECSIRLSSKNNEGWMQTAVDVKVPNFEGSFNCAVEIEEWDSFVQLLQKLESAIGNDLQVSWENMEGNIGFTFILKRMGGLAGSYRFSSDNFSLGPVLSGHFTADQSFLRLWTKSALESANNVL